MNRISNIHPGEILEEEFVIPFKITSYRLAKETHLSATRISDIIKKKRSITPDTALRLSKYFGNSPEFWLGLQMEYDLREQRDKINKEFIKINKIKEIQNVN